MNTDSLNVFPYDPCEFPFNIEFCGITNCTEYYMTERWDSHCYIIEYIVKGKGVLKYNGKTYFPEAGDMYIIHKGSNHKYYPDAEDPWDKIWFNIDGILVSSLLTAYGLFDTVLIKQFNNRAIFEELYELTCVSNNKKQLMEIAAVKFHEILQEVYTRHNRSPYTSKANAVKDYLDSNIYSNDVSVQDIAKQLCLSKTQVISHFKKSFGQTPYQYFINQRIKIAASMLLNTHMSITEIAENLDFSSQHYFSYVFKNITGLSPRQFQQKYLGTYMEKSNYHYKTVENMSVDLNIR